LDELDAAVDQLHRLDPEAAIGHGPDHPVQPDPGLAEQTRRWLELHPLLDGDAGYVAFLRRYSGAFAAAHEGWYWVTIPGFSDVGDYIHEVEPGLLDDRRLHCDARGLYHFATLCGHLPGAGDPARAFLGFGFRATSGPACGVYRAGTVRNSRDESRVLPPEWFCGTFVEWLRRVVDRSVFEGLG
jgi:hypothetical protein